MKCGIVGRDTHLSEHVNRMQDRGHATKCSAPPRYRHSRSAVGIAALRSAIYVARKGLGVLIDGGFEAA